MTTVTPTTAWNPLVLRRFPNGTGAAPRRTTGATPRHFVKLNDSVANRAHEEAP
jgi:hypothetical protein